MASLEDIAAMKLNSIMNRGAKKDFFDLYQLLEKFTLKELISFYNLKYSFNSELILWKSLVYFDDAENEPDPVSIKNIAWCDVKDKISKAVRLL
jgi:predicted nucleotidyltransferase component of viral defense system